MSNIISFVTDCLSLAIPAYILGIIIEKYFERLTIMYPNKLLILGFTQLIVSISILYYIQTYISSSYAYDWQHTTPGLFFGSIFFGIQSHLYSNIYKST